MSRACMVLLALTLVAQSLSGQSGSLTESMTEEQLEQFNRSRLSVDVWFTKFSVFSLESYRRWTGRQGFDRVTEPQFYAVAGYPEEAKKAQTHRTVGWSLFVGGGAMAAGGFAWMTLGLLALEYGGWDYMDAGFSGLFGGAIVSLVGTIPLALGSSRVRRNWSSVEQAEMAADKYNRNLAKRIRGE